MVNLHIMQHLDHRNTPRILCFFYNSAQNILELMQYLVARRDSAAAATAAAAAAADLSTAILPSPDCNNTTLYNTELEAYMLFIDIYAILTITYIQFSPNINCVPLLMINIVFKLI